jgi:hypothetical protein
MILWMMGQFDLFGVDEPEDLATGLKRTDHER